MSHRKPLNPGGRIALSPGDRTALAPGERAAAPVGARLPVAFGANPDLWLDYSRDQTLPGSGAGDTSPDNLPVYSSVTASAFSASEEPIDRGTHWEFAGDDAWELLGQSSAITHLTVAAVTTVQNTNLGTVVGAKGSEGSTLWTDVRDGRVEARVIDDDGNQGGARVRFDMTPPTALVCTWAVDPLAQTVDLYTTVANAIGVGSATGSMVYTNLTAPLTDVEVGGTPGTSWHLVGDLQEVAIFQAAALSQTHADELRDHLAEKWSIL